MDITMKKMNKLTGFVFLLLSGSSFSEPTFVCQPPEGLRVDYFDADNTINKPKNEFLTDTDKISGMHPTIIFHDKTKEATFILGNTSASIAKTMKANMAIIYNTKEQISFAGVINEAPILASYYPMMHILAYSQQSDWAPNANGMRSAIYYSKCNEQ